MQEIVRVRCPGCGAVLGVAADRERSFCTYCAAEIVTKERRVGVPQTAAALPETQDPEKKSPSRRKTVMRQAEDTAVRTGSSGKKKAAGRVVTVLAVLVAVALVGALVTGIVTLKQATDRENAAASSAAQTASDAEPRETAATETPAVVMPDVTGMTYAEACAKLEESGFTSYADDRGRASAEPDRYLVKAQSTPDGKEILPDTRIVLTCVHLCRLYIEVETEMNLLFHTYDITISFNGAPVGTAANGGSLVMQFDVPEGLYPFTASRADDPEEKYSASVSVTEDETLHCVLKRGRSVAAEEFSVTPGIPEDAE